MVSSNGVRVVADGRPVLENWAWHGPTRNTGKLTLPAGKTVEILVEHFYIDGQATQEFSLVKASSQQSC